MKPQLTLVSPESCELLYTLTQTFEGRKAKVAESLRTFRQDNLDSSRSSYMVCMP